LLYPDDLKYSREHEWARISGGEATVGITHFAQDKLGDVVFVELPKAGAELKQMDEFGVVESVKTVSNLFCPLSGKVIEVNDELASKPELVNEDPYGKGWIVKVKMSNPADASKLLGAAEYKKLIEA
jgi:glycine cleavage system H protein